MTHLGFDFSLADKEINPAIVIRTNQALQTKTSRKTDPGKCIQDKPCPHQDPLHAWHNLRKKVQRIGTISQMSSRKHKLAAKRASQLRTTLSLICSLGWLGGDTLALLLQSQEVPFAIAAGDMTAG
ncbi:hypothetical protein DdX_13103 [Ditylenchus destructor]|uniref:Uncharacterized protein n=1 Tax=Ditylenchus destructor TaxID=166010 RepID=A0AAD4QZS6_9BILA|nr:hypothetical protein DdX_13103 [Ditylenchus destructor]